MTQETAVQISIFGYGINALSFAKFVSKFYSLILVRTWNLPFRVCQRNNKDWLIQLRRFSIKIDVLTRARGIENTKCFQTLRMVSRLVSFYSYVVWPKALRCPRNVTDKITFLTRVVNLKCIRKAPYWGTNKRHCSHRKQRSEFIRTGFDFFLVEACASRHRLIIATWKQKEVFSNLGDNIFRIQF